MTALFNSKGEADVWRQLIAKVTSKYVYIGREAVHFTQFDRLERLVREINNLDVHVVASAIRGYHSGKVGEIYLSSNRLTI